MAAEVLALSPREAFGSSAAHRAGLVASPRWESVLRKLKTELHAYGFDIAAPLAVDWYNQALPEEHTCRIPTFSPTGGKTLAVLVGNNKNLWRIFLDACSKDTSLQESDDPLDTYVERSIQAASSSTKSPVRIFWGHHENDGVVGGPSIELQRMASVSGLSYWEETSFLSLHPKYGPWFALRAVIVFDGIEYTGPRASPVQNPMSEATQAYVRMAVRSARSPSTDNLPDLGGNKLGERRSSQDEMPTRKLVASRWQRWLAVRDAPFPGHPWRYPKAMLEYHYTGNRACLQPPQY